MIWRLMFLVIVVAAAPGLALAQTPHEVARVQSQKRMDAYNAQQDAIGRRATSGICSGCGASAPRKTKAARRVRRRG